MGAVAYGVAEKVSESSGSPATREVTSDIELREFSSSSSRQAVGVNMTALLRTGLQQRASQTCLRV